MGINARAAKRSILVIVLVSLFHKDTRPKRSVEIPFYDPRKKSCFRKCPSILHESTLTLSQVGVKPEALQMRKGTFRHTESLAISFGRIKPELDTCHQSLSHDKLTCCAISSLVVGKVSLSHGKFLLLAVFLTSKDCTDINRPLSMDIINNHWDSMVHSRKPVFFSS